MYKSLYIYISIHTYIYIYINHNADPCSFFKSSVRSRKYESSRSTTSSFFGHLAPLWQWAGNSRSELKP